MALFALISGVIFNPFKFICISRMRAYLRTHKRACINAHMQYCTYDSTGLCLWSLRLRLFGGFISWCFRLRGLLICFTARSKWRREQKKNVLRKKKLRAK